MISLRAQSAIQQIFLKAAESRLVIDQADRCDVSLLEQGDSGMPGEYNAYVLTISSMQFRMLLILRAGLNEETRQYYLGNEAEKSFEEVFLEVTNLCCGAINQELIHYFPDLGMSTPYRLSNQCIRFIDALKPSHLSSYAITINETVKISAALCVCAHASIDFEYAVAEKALESGELEMF